MKYGPFIYPKAKELTINENGMLDGIPFRLSLDVLEININEEPITIEDIFDKIDNIIVYVKGSRFPDLSKIVVPKRLDIIDKSYSLITGYTTFISKILTIDTLTIRFCRKLRKIDLSGVKYIRRLCIDQSVYNDWHGNHFCNVLYPKKLKHLVLTGDINPGYSVINAERLGLIVYNDYSHHSLDLSKSTNLKQLRIIYPKIAGFVFSGFTNLILPKTIKILQCHTNNIKGIAENDNLSVLNLCNPKDSPNHGYITEWVRMDIESKFKNLETLYCTGYHKDTIPRMIKKINTTSGDFNYIPENCTHVVMKNKQNTKNFYGIHQNIKVIEIEDTSIETTEGLPITFEYGRFINAKIMRFDQIYPFATFEFKDGKRAWSIISSIKPKYFYIRLMESIRPRYKKINQIKLFDIRIVFQ